MLRIAFLCLVAVAATPAEAKERTIIDPLASEVVANMNVTSVEVAVAPEAEATIAPFDAKAAEKRANAKLPPFDPATRPKKEELATVPLVNMLPVVMQDMSREWGLIAGRDVKVRVKLDTLKTANAGMAILISGSSDQLAGTVTVHDAATDEKLGSFYIDVINSHSGWGGMLMRGGGVREKLAEEFSRETTRLLTGRKSQKAKKKA